MGMAWHGGTVAEQLMGVVVVVGQGKLWWTGIPTQASYTLLLPQQKTTTTVAAFPLHAVSRQAGAGLGVSSRQEPAPTPPYVPPPTTYLETVGQDFLSPFPAMKTYISCFRGSADSIKQNMFST